MFLAGPFIGSMTFCYIVESNNSANSQEFTRTEQVGPEGLNRRNPLIHLWHQQVVKVKHPSIKLHQFEQPASFRCIPKPAIRLHSIVSPCTQSANTQI
jgi:hypothetical protein